MYEFSLFANAVVFATTEATVNPTAFKFLVNGEEKTSITITKATDVEVVTTPYSANASITYASSASSYATVAKKDSQNKGIGTIVSNELSKIAYYKLGIEEVVYTSKNENIQSQKSLEKIGAELTSIHDGYHFYKVNLKEKLENIERRMK